jgi:hypothetical protein
MLLLADSGEGNALLEEMLIQLRMELFRRNSKVQRFVTIEGHVIMHV